MPWHRMFVRCRRNLPPVTLSRAPRRAVRASYKEIWGDGPEDCENMGLRGGNGLLRRREQYGNETQYPPMSQVQAGVLPAEVLSPDAHSEMFAWTQLVPVCLYEHTRADRWP